MFSGRDVVTFLCVLWRHLGIPEGRVVRAWVCCRREVELRRGRGIDVEVRGAWGHIRNHSAVVGLNSTHGRGYIINAMVA